jgi:hypothetical protein
MQFAVSGLVACCVLVLCGGAQSDTGKEAQLMRRRVFALSPMMKVKAVPATPGMCDKMPDADVVGKGSLGMEPRQPYAWVTSPGSDFEFTARGASIEGIDRALLTIWDWENRPVAQTSFAMPFTGRVTCKVEGRGTWVLTLDAMRGEECAMRLIRSFSVCPDNTSRRSFWKKSGFWVGQCSFPGWHDVVIDGRPAHPPGLSPKQSRELEADLIARMGVGLARINLVVKRRDADGFDLDFGLADECVNAYVSRGLGLDLQLFMPYGDGMGPVLDKYAGVTGGAIYPLKEKPYRHYVRETVRRYGRHAAFFQIGNEPGNPHQYSGTADEYVEQVRQAVDEIRRAGSGDPRAARRVKPRVPITNGGYCFDNDDTRRIASGVRGLTDFVSYHWHGDLPGLKAFRADIERMHRDAGHASPEYANTEMGYHMPTVGAERSNAIYEMQKLLYCWAHGDLGVLLYASRELWWPRQHDKEYGFFDYFFCPRYVYGAASAFLDKYAGFRFSRVLKETDNLFVYEFVSGKRSMVAAFAVKKPVQITLTSDARSAVLIDPMGNETPLADAKKVTLQAGEFPQSVVFDGASDVALCE